MRPLLHGAMGVEFPALYRSWRYTVKKNSVKYRDTDKNRIPEIRVYSGIH